MTFQKFFLSLNGLERVFFSSAKWFGMEFWAFLSSEVLYSMVRKEITKFWVFFSSIKWFEMDFQFSNLQRNGLEKNSDRFSIFETDGIPM